MGLILRTGLGTKKLAIVIPVGKNTFKTLKEEGMYGGIVKVEKTDSHPVNNQWLIEQYRFGYYDETGSLRSYLLGNPLGEKDFYMQEIRSLKMGDGKIWTPVRLFAGKAQARLAKILDLEKACVHPSFERNLLYIWNYTKDYLKNEGVERLITQAEFELVDAAAIDIKIGWRDIDRKRSIEQYGGNREEREKHYTIPERLCGTVYLEYPLNDQSSE